MGYTRKLEDLREYSEVSITEEDFMEDIEYERKYNNKNYTFTEQLQKLIRQVYDIGYDNGMDDLQYRIEDMVKNTNTDDLLK